MTSSDEGGSRGGIEPDATATAAVSALGALARRLAAAERLEPPRRDAELDAIVATAALVLDAQAASIALHDPATDRLRFVAAAGPSAGEVVGLEIDATAGIAGFAFGSGQPLAVTDVSADPRFDRTVAEATGYVPGTLLAVPLADAAGVIGVLEVLDRRDGSFTMHDLDVAAAFANQATVAVRASRVGRDAATVLRSTLVAIARETAPTTGRDAVATPLDDEAIDLLVRAALADLRIDADTEADASIWALADRLARLRDVDPELVAVAGEWLDVLLRRRAPAGGRSRTGRR
ncbi:MAG TPA: GAF domain-containing protein [Candidatus Saccharimonadales bacterium]|nr:GAF domain-containing protein [Candidatus Saccharimonadales bacterium]